MRILIVEDEKELRESLIEGLRLDGYAVDACAEGKTAEEMAYFEDYDLIILDLNLPEMDGLSVLEVIRKTNKEVNIIILTARSTLEDKIVGLDGGANDYMTKPFHFAELQARIRSLLRRRVVQEDTVLSCNGVSLDTASRRVMVRNSEVMLTHKETCLLEYFLLNRERIIKQEELINHVWDNSVDPFSNSVRVHISSLRRKLKTRLGYDPIQNLIGEGYILKESR